MNWIAIILLFIACFNIAEKCMFMEKDISELKTEISQLKIDQKQTQSLRGIGKINEICGNMYVKKTGE